jgi:hypothetical protein
MQRKENPNYTRPIYEGNAAFIETKYGSKKEMQSVITSAPVPEIKNIAYGLHY